MTRTPLHRNLSRPQNWRPLMVRTRISMRRRRLEWPETPLLARSRRAKLSSTIFPRPDYQSSKPSWGQRRRRCPNQDRAFVGSSRLTCRWGRGHSQTETSALPRLCWSPTSRWDRPGNIRRAQETTGFLRSAQASELSALAPGENGALSCSISFSSMMPGKYVRMTSKQRRKPKNSQRPPSWPAEAADSEPPEATFACFPQRGASSDYYAWDAMDAICANVRLAYANGKWTARLTPTRTAQAQRMSPSTIGRLESSSLFDARNSRCDA